MLSIITPKVELFDERTQEFSTLESVTLELEHSLLTLSKWESEFQKPFLAEGIKTAEELLGYVKYMIITPVYPPDVFDRFSQENLAQINEYIDSKQTATVIYEIEEHKGKKAETVTAELIYYWMISYQIPLECERWHLNRLFTLIRVFNVKNSKPKKQSRADMAAHRQRINAERKAKYGTNG